MVSGVLAGQSLIQSAKRQALIEEYKTIDTSFMAFHLEYNAIPGDFDEAWDYWGTDCADTELKCNGDGNKKIESYTGTPNEAMLTFDHLALADILPHKESNISGTTVGDRHYTTSYENSKFVPRFRTFSGFSNYFNNVNHSLQQKHMLYFWGAKAGQFTGSWLEGGIGGKDLYNIDSKIDDGLPFSGNIIARNAEGVVCVNNNNEYVKSSNNIQMCVAGFYLSL